VPILFLIYNDASAFDNSDKCNLLNDYFCSIPDLQDDDIPLPDFDDRGPNTLTDITVVEQDIIDIISLLDLNEAVDEHFYSFPILFAICIF
jgi:hypothetical protein